jgi:hypothetical protein
VFHRLVVQGVKALILFDAVFPLDRVGEEKKRKKIAITMRKEGCPRAGPALLALHQVQLLGAIKS